jgi:hypothetical protein
MTATAGGQPTGGGPRIRDLGESAGTRSLEAWLLSHQPQPESEAAA